MAETTAAIPERSQIAATDRWDLGKLFSAEDAWEQGLKDYQDMVPRIAAFKGTLGESAASLRACLEFLNDLEMVDERVGYYAMLRTSEDAGDSDNQGRFARYLNVASRAEAEKSYITPEIQAIPDAVMEQFLADESLAEFAIALRKLLRFKPHVLPAEQERLLALQIEANQTARKAFAALTDVDLDFGTVDTADGPVPLSQSSWSQLMINPDRGLRRRAYLQFYGHFEQHKNTLAALYGGSVQLDIYRARVRGYPSAREAALFPDRVDPAVYDNLVAAVHDNLGQLHAYYGLRRRRLGVDELRHYDVYVPLTADVRVHHTYEQAVDVVIAALAPLGDDYRATLRAGLLGGWVDRYENKGKRSGAFSSGSFVGDPYILMNYKDDVLRDVFTLAHEAGHSMHSLEQRAPQPHPALRLHHLRGRGGLHLQRAAPVSLPVGARRQPRDEGLPGRQAGGRHHRHHLPADHVRRVRAPHPPHGRTGRAAHRGLAARHLPAAPGELFRRRVGAGRGQRPGGIAHPALLQRVLRLQVRHRPGGGGVTGGTGAGRRCGRTRAIHGVSALRRLALPDRVAAARRRGHERPGAGGAGAARVRLPGGPARTALTGRTARRDMPAPGHKPARTPASASIPPDVERFRQAVGQGVECRLHRALVGGRGRAARAQVFEPVRAERIAGEQAVHVAAGDPPVAAYGPVGAMLQAYQRGAVSGPVVAPRWIS